MGKKIALGGNRPVEPAARAPKEANGVRLTTSQRARLGTAETLASGGWRDRQRAAALVREVEAEISAAKAGAAVERGIEDTLERARARGESFEIETVDVGEWRRNEIGGLARRDGQPILDVHTVRRASRVDGLANLHKAGSLSDVEKQTGDAYRAVMDRAKPPVAVSAYGSTQVGFKDVGHMLVSVAEAGSALAVISAIHRRVGDARAVAVLEAVAGRGATIRSLGDGGSLKAANLRRLKAGLAAAKSEFESLNEARRSKPLAREAR